MSKSASAAQARAGHPVANHLLSIRRVATEIDPGRTKGSQTLAHHMACAIRNLCDGIEALAADPRPEAGREELRKAVRKIATARRFVDNVDQPLISITHAMFISRTLGRAKHHLGELSGPSWRSNAAFPALEALEHLTAVLTLAGHGLPGADALLVCVGNRARIASARARFRLAPSQEITPRMFYDA